MPPAADRDDEGGFLFAFYLYNPAKDADAVSRAVHFVARYATRSPRIHVEMIPVERRVAREGVLLAAPVSYTAFMGFPFRAHDAAECLSGDFDLLYVPMPRAARDRGADFLRDLEGTPYSGPLTLWHVLAPGAFRGERAAAEARAPPPPSVFCSQAGLLLCLECGLVAPGSTVAPSACSPGALYDLLAARPATAHVAPAEVRLLPPPPWAAAATAGARARRCG